MEKLKTDTWLKFTFLSNLRFDHKGQNFLLSTQKANFKKNKYLTGLYFSSDGKLVKFGTKNDSNPKWSLNDKKIAFLRSKKKDKDKSYLCVYTLKDGSVEEFEIEKKVVDFNWYDSSSFILLCNDQSEDKEEGVYQAAEEIPFFSNGKGFVAGDRNRLYKYRLKTGKVSTVTPENLKVHSFKIIDKNIYFIAQDIKNSEKYPMIDDVYVILNKEVQKLTNSDMSIMDFDVKNNKLIFVASDFEYDLVTFSKLFVMDLKTKKTKKFLKDPEISLGNSTNSDSRGSTRTLKVTDKFIYCEGTKRDRAVIYKVNYSGKYETIEKDYSFDDFDVNENGEILFVKNSSCELPNLYILKNGKERLVKKFNNIKFKSTLEKFKVKGSDIDAWIMKPYDFDPNKKYPAILEIHGGPMTVYGEGFMYEFHLLASKGYVVIYSNPFGSDGYGQDFADLRGKYGTKDYQDLMKVVDSAIEQFDFIDKDRLGVTGGSYGGFMTNWIIGHTDRFKAAVTQRSISNWISMFGISDIGYFFSETHIGQDPWTNQESYIEKSPLTYAKNFKTPTLIIHSKEDYRCPIAEGYQLFTALRYNGVEARMVLFEGENHNLSRTGKPKQKTQRLKEILDWFDKYIGEKK